MYNILIVDDENIVRLALRTIIYNNQRYKIVAQAKDGIKAIDIISKEAIDIVITDLKMPNMDGITLIKLLKQMDFRGKILVLSNYDDYTLVREAMKYGACDYLLKLDINENVVTNILNQLAKELDEQRQYDSSMIHSDVKKEQRQGFLNTLILESSSINDISRHVKDYELSISLKKNMLILITIDDIRKEDIKKRLRNNSLLQTSIINIILGQLQDYFQGEVIGFEYRDFILIINLENEKDVMVRVYTLINNIMKTIHLYLNLTVSTIIGPIVKDLKEMSTAARIARSKLSYKFYKGNQCIIESDKIHYCKIDITKNYSSMIILLKEHMRLGELDIINAQIDNLFNTAKEKLYDPDYFKSFINIIIESFIGVLVEVGDSDIEYIDEMKKKINNQETINDYHHTLNQLIKDIHNRILNINTNTYRKEVALAIDYIHNHLDKKITVRDISREINLTESSLYKLFKNETKETIIQYINRTKIEKAMVILRSEKDCLIKDVANRIGIKDQFYFIRLFKKYVGITPSQYRNQ